VQTFLLEFQEPNAGLSADYTYTSKYRLGKTGLLFVERRWVRRRMRGWQSRRTPKNRIMKVARRPPSGTASQPVAPQRVDDERTVRRALRPVGEGRAAGNGRTGEQ
jgi:hypothetical protein